MSDKPKAVLARELNDRAKALDKATEQNPMELGAIAYTISNDRELLAALGFGSVKEWGERTFQKRWKSIQNLAKVYAKLHVECGWEKLDIVAIGTVKANLLARLPESEIRKEEWATAVKGLNTSDFKQKVLAHMEEHGSDHREGFCRIGFDAPKSFRDETWKPFISGGMAYEGTEDSFEVIVKAIDSYNREVFQTNEQKEANVGTAETPGGEDAETPSGLRREGYANFLDEDRDLSIFTETDTPEAKPSENQAGEGPTST